MPQQHIDIEHAAKLSRLNLTAEELVSFQGQLGKVVDYIALLESQDLSDVEPVAHAMPVFDVWREDEPRPGIGTDLALSNAPRQNAGQFLVNRSVEDA